MKASLFFAFFCLAAVAVTTASAMNIEDVPEHENVEAIKIEDGLQPLFTCQVGGGSFCDWHCWREGRGTGYCDRNNVCHCDK